MLKTWIGLVSTLVLLTACAPMTVAPGSASAPQIQGTPGKAVIYVVRSRPDLSYLTSTLTLNDQLIGSTHAGTYIRLEVTPGRHRISGYAQDNGAIALDVQADRVYFVQHTVSGSWRATNPHSFFRVIDENAARAAMAGARPVG
ncbi:MAG: DUF2846 domain-containing protein [Pseudomonadota bacterium]